MSSGNSAGSVFINAKWQFNANAMYQAAYGIEIAGNVFGRQGYPYPMFRTQALGADTGLAGHRDAEDRHVPLRQRVEHGPARGAEFKLRAMSFRLIGDLFNVLNANTALVRNNNVLALRPCSTRSRRTSARGSSGRASSSGSKLSVRLQGALRLRRRRARRLRCKVLGGFAGSVSQRALWLRSQARAFLYSGHAAATSFQNAGE